MNNQPARISDALTKQVAEILPNKEGLADLMAKRKIRLYLGIDPTSPHLHLGHAVLLRKLRQFQDLGHEVIFLFGTFTARIGDPSGKDKARCPLTEREIKNNMKTYLAQASKILDVKKVKVKRNGEWLEKMRFGDVLELASHMTVPRLLERDMFQERMKKGQEVWMHELLYPLLQGYDSVAMDVDLEIGGTDQTFNMLVGRQLQKDYHDKEKFVLTVPLLLGADGRKMSKSLGNTIALADSPNDMFGKVMALHDELIAHYFELCTDRSAEAIAKIREDLKNGSLHPRDAKESLAGEIVALYHGTEKAKIAAEEFSRVFQKKELPSEIEVVAIKESQLPVADFLVALGLAPSKAEARRLIAQGGVAIDGVPARDANTRIAVRSGMVVRVGKRKFRRVA